MAFNWTDNHNYQGKKPDFERQQYETLEDLKNVKATRMPEMYLAYCLETRKIYLYDKQNEEDPILGYWREFKTGGSGGDSSITKTITTNIEVGGIAKGETIANGTTLTELAEKLFVKYNKPGLTVSSTAGTIFEIGSTVNTNIKAVVTKNSYAISSIVFKKGNEVLEEKTEGVSEGGTFQINIPDITENSSFSVIVDDGSAGANGSVSIKFITPYYYGGSDINTDIDVTTLSKKVEDKGNKTISFTLDNKYCIFAYPSSYGNLKSIKDSNNFEYIDSFDLLQTESFKIYVSKKKITCTDYKYIFSY